MTSRRSPTPQPALAAEIVKHIRHEADSWGSREPVPPEVLAAVLSRAGVHYNAKLPVTYASPCPFRGHIVPHLVVQTDNGPVTVMLLSHEQVKAQAKFTEGEYHGVVFPTGSGSIAVLAPTGREFEGALEQVVEGAR
jgi:hypothetical protein